jgi:glycosyltransferase involved in cell wall biosynthesis
MVALHHDFSPTVPRHFQSDGVNVLYVGQMHTRKIANTTDYFGPFELLKVTALGAIRLALQAIRLQADVYHICKPHPQNGFAGVLAANLSRNRRVFLDSDDFEAGINRFSNGWQQRVVAALENGLPHLVEGVTVHTRFLSERIQKLGIPKDRILRLPSCVDARRFRSVSPCAVKEWQERLGIREHDRVIVFVGTMALNSHPVDLLLESFARLSAKMDDVVLLLVGGGPDLLHLQEIASQLDIASRCRFVGRVKPDEVPPLLSLADVSVDPVYDDEVAQARWPVKIMESMAMGVPVVTGDIGDRAEILGGKAGVLVTPGSPESLARGIESVLIDSCLHEQFASGCKYQSGKYNIENVTSKLLAFYEGKGDGKLGYTTESREKETQLY